MTIVLKNKETLYFNEFKFKCCAGKNGFTKNKTEGDKKTPKGTYSLGNLYYRRNRNTKPFTKLRCIPITKEMGWCNDLRSGKYYNKLISTYKNVRYEKLHRIDYKYDYFIPINYNTKKTISGKGSAIFIHLTKNYKPTAGCIAVQKKDFLILIKLINRNTKIKII